MSDNENDGMQEAIEMVEQHLYGSQNLRCKDCGFPVDPDQEACVNCGWKNPILEFGLI